MSLSRPTRAELRRKFQAAIESRLTGDQLRRSNAKAYAAAFAGVADAIYSLVDFDHRQQFVYSCEAEYLERHAALYGISRIPAESAEGVVVFDVSAGGDVPAGTELQTDDGILFTTLSDAEDGVSRVRAQIPGVGGNLPAGTLVSLVSPIEGVALQGVVDEGGIAGGADAESDDSLRARTLVRMRETPMGGAVSDYKTWAMQVPGVSRVWVSPLEDGEGTVVVRFVCDTLEDIIPTEEMVAKVQQHLNDLKPVTASVRVKAPVAFPVDIVFADFTGADGAEAVVEADLRTLFRTQAEPGIVMPISHIRATISNATGEQDFSLSSPSESIVPGVGRIPVLRSIVWP